MGVFKNYLRLLLRIFVLNFVIFLNCASGKVTSPSKAGDDVNETDRIPIGVVFDQNTNQIQHAFKIAMVQHAKNNTSDYLNFQVFVDVINTADSFKLSRLVCNQFSRGVIAILAAVHPDSFDTFHSYANTFHMPFVTPFFPEKVLTPTSGLPDYAMSILPDYHKAVLGTVTYYGWKNVIYMYDSHDGMLRLQQLFKSLIPGKTPFFRVANVKRIATAKEIIIYLRQMEKADRWSNKYVILDCSTAIAKETLISHVRDVQLGRRNYHYLFSGLVLDDRWDREIREYGTINMTGFRLVDTSRKFVKDFFATWKLDSIAAKGALMYDAAHTVLEAFQRILRYKPHIMESLMNKTNAKYRFLNCDTQEAVPLKYGDEIADFIKRTQVEGLSGKIRFTGSGIRKNFSLVVVRNNPDGELTKIATWYDDKGFRPLKKLNGLDTSGKYDRNKIYTIVSIQEPPYFTSSKPRKDTEEDDDIVYGGFCAELAELIAEKLHITIQFRLSADGKYGNVNPNMIGGWDGMVGELVRKEVDMVVAPLIVTAERETVIDFSKPFLSFNRIGPKPKKEKPPLLGFLKPLSKETWYLLASSVMLVSIVMFIVSRFSPMEWRVVAITDTPQSLDTGHEFNTGDTVPRASVINTFSLSNSIWYSLGSAMQQGSDVAPRSVSGRIVSTVWWFFVLIIVCSYTAYLASQLTIIGMETPEFPAHNRMAHCPEDIETDGKKETITDDEDHGNADILALMSQPRDYVRPVSKCEMLVTVLDPGIKDFAVALPKGSKLRTGVNLALAEIREAGEMNRLLRKFFHNTECGASQKSVGGNEMTLDEISGLFYVLLSGLLVALCVSVVEFCNYHHSDAAKANISIKTALHAKSRLQLNEGQEPRNTNRRRRREQERGWNGSGAAPGSYAGYSSYGYHSMGQAMVGRCASRIYTSNMPSREENILLELRQEHNGRQNDNNPLQLAHQPLAVIQENCEVVSERLQHNPPYMLREPLKPTSPTASSPMNPMKPIGVRHVMSSQRRRDIIKQVKECHEAIELHRHAYFTPANQSGQEETALQNSFTQV